MTDSPWLDGGAMPELVRRLVVKATRDYRIDPAPAAAAIREILGRSPELRRLAAREADPDRIARTALWKRLRTAARRRIYYSLRRYRQDTEQLAADVARLEALPPGSPAATREEVVGAILRGHASTRERLGHLDEFYDQLFALAGEPETVLDVGCGFFPLTFPFAGRGDSVRHYLAADKDPLAIAALAADARWRADGRFRPLRWDLADGWAPVREAAGVGTFDLALVLKMVPVIQRQEPQLLAALAAVPARRLLVTGSRLALARRRSIERRERGVVARFVRDAGLKAVGELKTGDELGWLVVEALRA